MSGQDAVRYTLENEPNIVEVEVEYRKGNKAKFDLPPGHSSHRQALIDRLLAAVRWEKAEEVEIEYVDGRKKEIDLEADPAKLAPTPVQEKVDRGEEAGPSGEEEAVAETVATAAAEDAPPEAAQEPATIAPAQPTPQPADETGTAEPFSRKRGTSRVKHRRSREYGAKSRGTRLRRSARRTIGKPVRKASVKTIGRKGRRP